MTRDKSLLVRLSADEQKSLRELATASDQTVSDYVRSRVLTDLYDLAEARVNDTPELEKHSAIILQDWPEGDEHWHWVITAPVAEIVSWAEYIEDQVTE